MLIFPRKTVLEVLSGVWINLTSIYFGALLVSPSIFSINSFGNFWDLTFKNLPAAVLYFVIAVMAVSNTDMSSVRMSY